MPWVNSVKMNFVSFLSRVLHCKCQDKIKTQVFYVAGIIRAIALLFHFFFLEELYEQQQFHYSTILA